MQASLCFWRTEHEKTRRGESLRGAGRNLPSPLQATTEDSGAAPDDGPVSPRKLQKEREAERVRALVRASVVLVDERVSSQVRTLGAGDARAMAHNLLLPCGD